MRHVAATVITPSPTQNVRGLAHSSRSHRGIGSVSVSSRRVAMRPRQCASIVHVLFSPGAPAPVVVVRRA